MKKLYTTILLMFVYFICPSQGFNWVKQFTGTGNGVLPAAIKVDAGGNVYTVGEFQGLVDLDPGPGVYTLTPPVGLIGNAYISKLDASGNFVWAKRFTGVDGVLALSVAVDISGDVYVTGQFEGVVDFDPGPGTYTLSCPVGAKDVYVCKLTSVGNFVWAKKFEGVATYLKSFSIEVDATGNVYTTGHYDYITDFDPGPGVYNLTPTFLYIEEVFISKLDVFGNFVWAKSLGGGGTAHGYDLALDATGNIYTTGGFSGTGDFDPGPGSVTLTATGGDVFVSKLNAIGNFVWVKKMGGFNNESGFSIAVDASANVYTSGNFQNASDFDPGPGVFNLTSTGGYDIFISKLDVSGNFIWARKMGGSGADRPYSLALDNLGNVYTTGIFYNTVDFDPGAGSYNLISAGIADIFVSKLNASGIFLSACKFGDIQYDLAPDITIDGNDNIYLTGNAGDTIDFDPGIGTYSLAMTGSGAYVLKLCQAGTPTITPNGTLTFCDGGNVILTSGVANTYSWNTGATTQSILVSVSGNYYVTITNTLGCSATAATISVSVNPSPTITVNSGSICLGQSFTIIPSGANSYTYQGGLAVVGPTITSSYSVVGTNTLGCVSSSAAIINVTVNPIPLVTAISNLSLICIGESVTLTAAGAITYSWSSGGIVATEVVSPTVTTNYIVTGTDMVGCANTATLIQMVDPCIGLSELKNNHTAVTIFPNPSNGVFKIQIYIDDGEINLVNTLGQKIYEQKIVNGANTLKISGLPLGIYNCILVQSNQQIASYKICVE